MPDVRVFAFGSPRVEVRGAGLQFHRRKTLALLIFLALRDRPVRREALTAFLWPEDDRRHAFASLRQCILELHQVPGDLVIESDADALALRRPAEVWVDVREFRQAVDACRRHSPSRPGDLLEEATRAVDLYGDGFLTGFTLSNSVEFDDWQSLESEALREDHRFLLSWLVEAQEAQKNYDQSLFHARQLLTADPLNEWAHRSIMRCLYLRGDRHAALQHYGHCAALLKRELGAEPEGETLQLLHVIQRRRLSRRNPPSPAHSRAGLRRPRMVVAVAVLIGLLGAAGGSLLLRHVGAAAEAARLSIAVIPYTGIGTDSHTAEWTARGLTELLTTKLTDHEAIQGVIGPEVDTYRTTPTIVRAIGSEFDSDYLIEGAILCSQGAVSIVTRVVDSRAASYVWKCEHEFTEGDLLAFLDRSAGDIADSLLRHLIPVAVQGREGGP